MTGLVENLGQSQKTFNFCFIVVFAQTKDNVLTSGLAKFFTICFKGMSQLDSNQEKNDINFQR